MNQVQKNKNIVFAYLVYKWMSRKKRAWVHPYVNARLLKGAFVTCFIDLREDENKFFNYFRMNVKSFDELLVKLEDGIRSEDTKLRVAITAAEMLAITLRYLGSGCCLVDLHYSYRVGRSTASKIVRKVCKTIWNTLKNETLPMPTEDMLLNIADHFLQHAHFPNCIGAVDRKHIRIIKPSMGSSLYFNYKHYHYIVLLGVADSKYKFTYIDVGAFGKDSDSTVLRRSALWDRITNNTLNISQSKPLHGTIRPQMPFEFVGDEAFGLHKLVLRSFSGRFLSHTKRIFNYRLSHARRYIECTFGILSNKWRIFHRPLNVNLDLCTDIVKACCILHNYVRSRDGIIFEDTLSIEGLEEIGNNAVDDNVHGGLHVNHLRNIWAEYFVSNVGMVPWQNERV